MHITRIVKSFSRKIGSSESYGSFDFSPQIIEAQVDIDLDTSEGMAEYQRVSKQLFQLAMDAHKIDVQEAAAIIPELRITLEKKIKDGLWWK